MSCRLGGKEAMSPLPQSNPSAGWPSALLEYWPGGGGAPISGRLRDGPLLFLVMASLAQPCTTSAGPRGTAVPLGEARRQATTDSLESVILNSYNPYPAMSASKQFSDDPEIRELASAILKRCGGEGEIIVGLRVLMNTREDALPREEVIRRLRRLQASCPPFAGRHSLELSPAAAA